MSLRKTVQVLFFLVIVIQSVTVFSQTDSAHWNYISKYSRVAITEMYYSKIPASIIMAQALHESGYGTSELAVKANNHFGIKCQSEWTGKMYTYKDDDSNTCFRLYDSVAESFRDHSNFLMTRPRYAFLFQLDPADYAAWAHGLKNAGYATNPSYANILIKLIEGYSLFQLDVMPPVMEPMNSITENVIPNSVREAVPPEPKVYRRNRIKFLVTVQGDNIKKLSHDLNLLNWEIRKYNEIPKNQDVHPGQVIYLQPKRKRAQGGYSFHEAEKGETMYSIAQLYGIKLKWLYKRNHMKRGIQPKAGQQIWLRGMKPGKKR